MRHTPARTGSPGRLAIRVGLALVVLSGGGVVAAAPSYADATTVADATGDPVRIDDQDDDGELTTTPVPRAKAVDIVSTTFVYRPHVLVVRAAARRVTRVVSQSVRVRAGGQDHLFVTDDRGRVTLAGRGGGESCRGGAASLDRATGVYRIEIPARCVGSPAQVRVGYRLDRVGDTTPSSTTLDDAVKGGGGRLYYRIGLGPRLTRG